MQMDRCPRSINCTRYGRVTLSRGLQARGNSERLPGRVWDADQAGLETSLEEQDLQRQIQRALLGLDVRHRTILIRRFGMDGQDGETFSAISKELGISHERVRQLQEEALNLLRQDTELQ